MDAFVHAPGDAGMVMVVFTLPSFDSGLEVIRDEFTPPKANTRESVFRHMPTARDHRDVLTADFRLGWRNRPRDGEVLEVFPHPSPRRLRRRAR